MIDTGVGFSRRRSKHTPRTVLLMACVVLFAAGALPAPVLAATGAGSTLSKSGSDVTNGSTAQSGGSPGVTAEGDMVNWVLAYRNATGAAAQVKLMDPIAGNQSYVTGSLRTPPGLAPGWSTDAGTSFVASEPGSGVNAIGATGTGINGSTGAQVTVQLAAPGFTTPPTSKGDGWEALFIGANVYNIHHVASLLNGFTQLDCHVKTTSAECTGYPAAYVSPTPLASLGSGVDLLVTSREPFAAVYGTRIYFPAGEGYNSKTNPNVLGKGTVGVACVDVATNASCGYTALDTAPSSPNYNYGNGTASDRIVEINGGAVIGTKYYLVGDQTQIYCFNLASPGAACAGYPLVNVADPGSGTNVAFASSLQTFGDGRFVFGNIARGPTSLPAALRGTRDLICIDTNTAKACPGFPKVAYGATFGGGGPYNSVLAPTLDASGNVVGICGLAQMNFVSHPFDCFDLTGAPVTGPTPLPQQIAGTTLFSTYGGVLRIGTRLYFAETTFGTGSRPATYTCWDFAIAARCRGFIPVSSGANLSAYTLRQDPNDPQCIWELGDAGVFERFDKDTGGLGCHGKGNEATLDVKPSQFYCDGRAGHVSSWSRLQISGISGNDYTGLAVSITDDNGELVPGWIGRAFPSGTTSVDISTIPYTGADTHLHFALTFANPQSATATVTATFTGDPVQVCFKTLVETTKCGAATAISNIANALTTGSNGVADSNSSGTATFLETAAAPSKCPAPAPPTPPNPPVPPPTPLPVTGPAALRLTCACTKLTLAPGQRATFNITVTNAARDALSSVRVCDALPAGLVFMSARPGARVSSGRFCWTVASLTGHATRTFALTVRAIGLPVGARIVDNITATASRMISAWTHCAVRVLAKSRAGGVTG